MEPLTALLVNASSLKNNNLFRVSFVHCWDKANKNVWSSSNALKEESIINTGIGFLDHMLDQFDSHAQIGLSIIVNHVTADNPEGLLKDQELLMEVIGTCIGSELKKLMPAGREPSISSTVFSCPLDEALVECTIGTSPSTETVSVFHYDLAPYGSFPKSTGRKKIGMMETQPLELFWKSICLSMSLSQFKLQKLRGHNGHHIVESSFKAFCRAFRCFLDDSHVMWNTLSDSFAQGISLQREASIIRCTRETSINVHLKMDGAQNISIKTGIPFLDDFFTALARECPSMSLVVECSGDLWVDDHHTTEDVAIAIGQAIHSAIGSKAGINRMWSSEAQQGDAHVRVVMDLSNRPCLFHDLNFSTGGNEMLDAVTSIEMIPHILESLVMNGHMSVHIIQLSSSEENIRDLSIATSRAFGRALYYCTSVDPRRCGATASSKGTLSI